MVSSTSRLILIIELSARMSKVRCPVLVWHPLHRPSSVKACLSNYFCTAFRADVEGECQGLSGKCACKRSRADAHGAVQRGCALAALPACSAEVRHQRLMCGF